jgi:ABC-type transport system involved in multi-copper enzyme maturation permease subunit
MTFKNVGHVAGAVFKESVRDRVPFSLVVFALVLMAASFLMSRLTAGQDLKVMKDLGLASMNAIGLLIAIFIGTGLVSKEVEKRNIYAILAKPLSRTTFVVGKFVGLVVTLAANLAMMTVAFYLMMLYMSWTTDTWIQKGWRAPALDPWLLAAVALTGVQLTMTTAVALFFSTFSTPLLSMLLTLGVWVAGHFSADLRNFQSAVDSPLAIGLAGGLYYLLPNLAAIDVKDEIVHGVAVPWRPVLIGVASLLAYTGVLVAAAVRVFQRRDLK